MRILAGPWVGEFGWELFCWQGYLRKLSEDAEVIVGCRPGHEYLYEDFAHDIYTHNPKCLETNMWACKGAEQYIPNIKSDSVLDPTVGIVGYYRSGPPAGHLFWYQRFINYGTGERSKHIVIHARNTQKWGSDVRNWEENSWNELVSELDGVVYSIGHPEQSLHIQGTIDKRGIPLHELADIIATARLIVGPSSGPMHFAALCKTNMVVWSGDENKRRYERDWNPFGVTVDYLPMWNPSPEIVAASVQDLKSMVQ